MFWKKKQEAVEAKWRWGLVGAFVVTMVINGLAGSTTLLGGVTTATVSNTFPSLFTPSGVTFAIWGIIYMLLAAFIVYLFGVGRSKKSALSAQKLTEITKLLILNLTVNTLWIITWQYGVLWLSVLLIIALLVTLVLLVGKLRTIQVSGLEYVLAKLPFSIYFGWVTVATVANIAVWLVSIGWSGWGIDEVTWTVLVLLIAATIGLVGALRNHDVAYLGVFIWAYFGILVKHMSPAELNMSFPVIIVTLSILLAIFVATGLQLITSPTKNKLALSK